MYRSILEFSSSVQLVNMVLNVHRNRTAYWGRGKGGMEEGEKETFIPIGTLSPPE